MAEFPYTQVAGKLRDFLSRIRETGVPPKVTNEWLRSIGFTSSNDRTIVPVLRFVGLIDASAAPTERWKQFRGAQQKAVLAEGMRLGYADLFQTYPDACARTATELAHFFSTKTSAGQRVVQLTVQTFKALCEQADFSSAQAIPIVSAESDSEGVPARAGRKHQVISPGLTVNINIQLAIPETSDEAVYDKFFAAFRKHLLTNESGGD